MSGINIGKMASKATKAANKTAKKAKKAGEDAVKKYADDKVKDLDDVGKTFEKKGIAAGVLEGLDAMSAGSDAAHLADALGLGPSDEAGKQFFAGMVNGALGNPIAAKDFMQAAAAFGKADKAGKSKTTGKAAPPQSVLPPMMFINSKSGPFPGWPGAQLPISAVGVPGLISVNQGLIAFTGEVAKLLEKIMGKGRHAAAPIPGAR